MPAEVSIVKCPQYKWEDVESSVRNSIELIGGIEKFIRKGDKVLLKPNLLSAKDPDRAITTHPLIVKAIAILVKELGAIPFIGDSPSIGNFFSVAEKTGMKDIAKELNIRLVEFKDSKIVESSGIYKRLEIASNVFDFDKIINIPKLKTHAQMLMTLAVKNMFGCVVGKRKAQWHLDAGVDRDYFAQMLLEVYLITKPVFSVMDAIVGMEGDGPNNGIPKKIGLIIASNDAVALDIVACRILGVPSLSLHTIRAAIKNKVGETDFNKIEIKGEKIENVRLSNFILPKTVGVDMGLPEFVKTVLKNSLTTKPVVNYKKCTLCEICVNICPPKILKRENKKLIFDYKNCIRCYCCQEVCPEGAMEIKQGWLIKAIS